MTDFKIEMRKMCRNPKCRMKLPQPVANEREAFCCRGCYNSFYLHRCRVCEAEIERTTASRKICKRSKCRNAWAAGLGFGRYRENPATSYPGPKNLERMQEVPAAQGVASASQAVEGAFGRWRQIAGPPLTPSQFHCAAVPDGEIVDGKPTWNGGSYERIEGKNRKTLEQHFDDLDKVVLDACAACGRLDDLKDVPVGQRWIALCYGCLARKKAASAPRRVPKSRGATTLLKPQHQIPDDLSIPEFLRRTPPAKPLDLAA